MAVLVTGASRGIGAAIARQLAPAHDVAIGYNESDAAAEDVATTVRDAGARAATVQADVSDSTAVNGMVETTVEELGELDAVVNNAGVVDPDRLTDLSDEQFERVVERTSLRAASRFYRGRSLSRVCANESNG